MDGGGGERTAKDGAKRHTTCGSIPYTPGR